jgi:hypothetical protein
MTNERQDQNAQERQALTENEIKAIAYFSVGKSSEGGFGGRDVSYKLSFAGDIDRVTRRMDPVANSGYSIGSLQTDLGQHRNAQVNDDVPTELVDRYQTWARAHTADRPGWVLNDDQRSQAIADLRRQGNEIRRDQGVDIDAAIKSRINTFLASDDGTNYVHGRDTGQIDKLMRAGNGRGDAGSGLTQLQGTALYQNSSLDDQAKLATLVVKLENQGGDRYYPRIINGINNGAINSVEDAKGVVDRILPNRPNGDPDYIEDGANHALKGTEILNALRNSDTRSPLNQAWQHVVADPLISPVDLRNMNAQDQRLPGPVSTPRVDQNAVWQPEWERQQPQVMPPLRAAGANPNLPAEYDTVKTLFLSPDQGKNFIRALDQGGSYSYGRPQAEGRNGATSGFYVSGDDFVVWNQDGQGHAFIGGNWRDIDRQNLTRVRNNDGTVDLNITENGTVSRLLHVDPRAPALRPDQQEERALQQQPAAPQIRGPGGRGGPDRDGPDQEHDRPPQAPRRAELISDPGFDALAHQTWLQTRSQLDRAPIEGLGDLSQHQRERLTANVAACVVGDVQTGMMGVTRIDASTFTNPQTGMPQYVIPGQGDQTTAHYRRIAVDVAQAIDTTVERSSEIARTGVEAREQKQNQEIAQAQTLNQDGPSGPTMKIGGRTIVMASGDGGGSGGGGDGGGAA